MIYVITHKDFDDEIVPKQNYMILHVGTNRNIKTDYQRDDTNINISFKNPNYCELTGLYWIWNNDDAEEDAITGLVHYRRFFCTRKDYLKYYYLNKMPVPLSEKFIKGQLEKVDLILPVSVKSYHNVEYVYNYFHLKEDLEIVDSVIKSVCPDYRGAFNKVMKSHHYYYANMMICQYRILRTYSKWLFSVMDEIEQYIDVNKYQDPYQKRVFGFISERLLQVWIEKNRLKVREYPVFNTEKRPETMLGRLIQKI